jgi:hypothetical protein
MKSDFLENATAHVEVSGSPVAFVDQIKGKAHESGAS